MLATRPALVTGRKIGPSVILPAPSCYGGSSRGSRPGPPPGRPPSGPPARSGGRRRAKPSASSARSRVSFNVSGQASSIVLTTSALADAFCCAASDLRLPFGSILKGVSEMEIARILDCCWRTVLSKSYGDPFYRVTPERQEPAGAVLDGREHRDSACRPPPSEMGVGSSTGFA